MREERGRIVGDVSVYEPYTLWGSIGGNVRVVERGKLYVRGTVYGDLTVEYGGRCHVFGRVAGSLMVRRGAKVIVSGVIGGDATNRGGRLYVDQQGNVLGKVNPLGGETKVDPPDPARRPIAGT